MIQLRQKMGRSSLAKSLLSIVVPVAIVLLLLTQISIEDVLDLITELSYNWVAVGILFYLITNIGRAFRLQLLLPGQKTQFNRLFPISIAQSMFNNILPARTGELSLLYFLKKYQAVSLDRGGVALVIARVSDYLAVAVIFMVAAVFISGETLYTSQTTGIVRVVGSVMLLTVIMLLSMLWWGRKSLFWTQQIVEGLGLTSRKVVVIGLAKLGQIVDAIEAIHSFRRYVFVFAWSLFIWGATFAWFYAFLWGMGIQPTWLITIVGSTFGVLSKAIPFISVGGLGAHEAGWTVGFMLVGFDKSLAISSGFAVNILTILTSVVFGGVALWVLRASSE